MKRTYENKHIRVFWDGDLCTHSAKCIMGLPSVFDVQKRPWVNVEGASPEEIAQVIDTCPSSALRYEFPGQPRQPEEEARRVTVTVADNGPYVITGECQLITAPGKELATRDRLVLCRCGQSRTMPFCDGSHLRVGFRDAAQTKDDPRNSKWRSLKT